MHALGKLINGTILFYNRLVDPTIMATSNEIASQQATLIQDNTYKISIFSDNASIHSDTIIRYYDSEMCLRIDSDTTYLIQTKARNRSTTQ